MILRYDRLGIEIPAGDPDPAGASMVQELMGGRFGEMSTLMNYTFQSFSFRGRRELRPFYELTANIAAEEYGHIEVVGATITSMLTGADPRRHCHQRQSRPRLKAGKGVLPVDSGGAPWTGDYSSPPAISSRTSRTTTSWRPARATASSRSTRRSTTPPLAPSPAT